MTHHCHAVGCPKHCPPRMLFCLKHWRALDKKAQRMIWAFYSVGQERRKDPTASYLIVQAMAVGYVAVNEGRWTKDEHADHVVERIKKFAPRLTDEEITKLGKWCGSELARVATAVRDGVGGEDPT